ncbi:MAG: MgtC/SapB family protein [Elusimicrobia bacterium]|nr:MgtC/SapB family protein [Elusimicrobiota bacterium]
MLDPRWVDSEMLKMLIALALGSVIGLEREVSDKAAGLRTNILICLGAALFTILSFKFGDDRSRIAAQIVSGIGFLGAGAIMREGEHVTGLTTAASIWAVAAIGMGVGYGYFRLAAGVTLLVLFVQLAFTQLDILIDDWRERHTYRLTSRLDGQVIDEISGIFRECRLHVMRRKIMKKNNQWYSEWYVSGGRKGQEKAVRRLLESKDVLDLSY